MLKNPTPHHFAVQFALLTTAVFLCVGGILYLVKIHGLGLLLLSSVFAGLTSYVLLRALLGRFLYRKIKPIYKLIKRTKSSNSTVDNVDITEDVLGEVEEQVSQWVKKQNEEIEYMKSIEKYRKAFIGNVSHELKTPIFTIQGYIETLADEDMDEERRAYYFDRTRSNVDRLTTIVEDLDTISKIESGTFALDLTEFDLRQLVLDMFQDLQIIANTRQIKLSLKENISTNTTVIADKDMIRQVLNNLIVNSIKYGKDQGHTKVGFYDLDNDLLVEIADDGPGIEEHHLNHLFDRFYRVDRSRSRSHGGSGLGLSIVKHIIEAHGQNINVRSTVGKGSTFGFTLRKVG